MGCQDDEAIAAGADRWESVIGQGLAYTVFLVIPVTSGIKESVMNLPVRGEAVFDGILPMVLSVVIGLVGIKGSLPRIVCKHTGVIEAGVVFPFGS